MTWTPTNDIAEPAPGFTYERLITFGECTPVGRGAMYFAAYFHLQGECREHAAETLTPKLNMLDGEVTFATISASCQYKSSLRPGDRVRMRMRVTDAYFNVIKFTFHYYRLGNGTEELVAEGEQLVACVRNDGDTVTPAALPSDAVKGIEALGADTSRLFVSDADP